MPITSNVSPAYQRDSHLWGVAQATRKRLTAVRAFHSAARAAGGRDDGGPGLRPYHAHYYGAFILDPDGHRIEAVCHAPDRPATEC